MVWQRFASRLTVSPRQITLQRGIINITTVNVSPDSIRSLEVYQSLLGRMLGYGSICIGTAATSGYEIVFNGLDDPAGVAKLIRAEGSGQ